MRNTILVALILSALCTVTACGNGDSSSEVEKEKPALSSVSVSESKNESEPEEEETLIPANEEQIKADLQDNFELAKNAKLTIDSVIIEKRMTTEETKEDIVYLTAEFTGPMCKGSVKGQAKYLLFNDGWGYDSFTEEEVSSEPIKEPTEEDCKHIYEELYKTDDAYTEISSEFLDIDEKMPDHKDNTYWWEYSFLIDGNNYYNVKWIVLNWNESDCSWHIYSGDGTKDLNGNDLDSFMTEYPDGTGGITSPDFVEFSDK